MNGRLGICLFLCAALAAIPVLAGENAVRNRADERVQLQGMHGESDSMAPPAFFSIYWPDAVNVGLERIDTVTGQGTHIWNFTIPPDPDYPWGEPYGGSPFGIAFDVDGSIYALVSYLDFMPDHGWSRLVRVNALTGEVSFIGDGIPLTFAGPEMDKCGNIYATGFTVGDPAGGPPLVYGDSYLYRIDKATGAAAQIGDTGRTDWMDLDFDSQGRLWATTENALWLLDTDTGAATFMTEILGVPQNDVPGVCEDDWPYMEVMTIAFDEQDGLWATAMRGFSACAETNGPVMSIDVETGMATVVGYTNLPYNHGGDIMATKTTVCHRDGKGRYREITIGSSAVRAHMAHGDVLPSGVGSACGCPSAPRR